VSTVAAHFEREEPRGEFVLVIGPPGEALAADSDAVDHRLRALIADMSIKDAAAVAAAEFGLPKREVYARALLLQGKGERKGQGNGPA
jgi:16S rRNA (cytidine1402-2'-O)-methyltransferase